jgi:hypothetical protein
MDAQRRIDKEDYERDVKGHARARKVIDLYLACRSTPGPERTLVTKQLEKCLAGLNPVRHSDGYTYWFSRAQDSVCRAKTAKGFEHWKEPPAKQSRADTAIQSQSLRRGGHGYGDGDGWEFMAVRGVSL